MIAPRYSTRYLKPQDNIRSVTLTIIFMKLKNEADLNERLHRLRCRVILEGRVIANLDQQVDRVRRKTKEDFDDKVRECLHGSCRTRLDELLSRIELSQRDVYQAQLANLHRVCDGDLHYISLLSN